MNKNHLLKNAPLIAIALLVVITALIFSTDDTVIKKPGNMQAGSSSAEGGRQSAPVNIPPVQSASTQQQAGNQVQGQTQGQTQEQDKPSATAAPMLANLIKGLEKKVAADPANAGNKMLLAQTYAEIGELEKGLNILKEVQSADPNNIKVKIVMASVLGKSNNPAELQQAMQILNDIQGADDPNIAGSVLLQRGRLYIKMGETESAKKEWNQALTTLPESSGYRKQVEIELARLN